VNNTFVPYPIFTDYLVVRNIRTYRAEENCSEISKSRMRLVEGMNLYLKWFPEGLIRWRSLRLQTL